jgi:hypothetical protein
MYWKRLAVATLFGLLINKGSMAQSAEASDVAKPKQPSQTQHGPGGSEVTRLD